MTDTPQPRTRQLPRLQRALAIRDHVLPRIRTRRALQRTLYGTQPIATTKWACHLSGETIPWEISERRNAEGAAVLLFSLRPPFSNWSTGRDQRAPSYAAALAGNQANRVLSYGLDLWRGNKTLSIQWEDSGRVELISMKSGSWEAEVLALR